LQLQMEEISRKSRSATPWETRNMATIEDLRLLLQFPSENLSIEYKSWLDITDKEFFAF
jgi:hypothetical protein